MYDVRHVLRKAGLRSTYSGYNYLASAVALVLKDPGILPEECNL